MSDRSRRPTLTDVARAAGTSTAVVSYVVNNGPRRVSDETRSRVERAISDLGYRRNSLAGALSSGRTNLVGLLVPDSSNAFFGELARHAESEAKARGYLVLLGNTEYDAEIEREYERAFSDLRAAGTLVVSIDPEGVPTDAPRVYMHAAPPREGEPSVAFDDRSGVDAAVAHLVGHGYEDIHCVTGPDDFGPSGLRVRYWMDAMERAGLATDGRVHRAPMDRIEATAVLAELVTGSRPRAVFATTDEHALALLRASSQRGIRVPEQLAIVGFDGIREALQGGVRLTTVAVPLKEMASAAFDLLDEDARPRSIRLDTALVVGETCGCRPA